MNKVINWSKVNRIFKRKGVNMRMISGENVMLLLNELDSSAEPVIHSHEHEQISYIMSGQCDFRLGDEILKLKKGDVVPIPPNVEHSLKVTSKEPVLNLDVFYPIREEYITKTDNNLEEVHGS